jgi:hypothetical protein
MQVVAVDQQIVVLLQDQEDLVEEVLVLNEEVFKL